MIEIFACCTLVAWFYILVQDAMFNRVNIYFFGCKRSKQGSDEKFARTSVTNYITSIKIFIINSKYKVTIVD